MLIAVSVSLWKIATDAESRNRITQNCKFQHTIYHLPRMFDLRPFWKFVGIP